MVAEGLTGSCWKEVSKTFGFTDEDVIDASVAGVLAYIKQISDPDVTFNMDNSLFTNKNIKIKEGYIKTLRDKYQFHAQSIDLSDPKSVKAINDRIIETTNGMIKQGVSMLSPSAFSVLVNTMYFKADWDQTFDSGQTIPLPFKLSDKETTVDTDFMVNRSARVGVYSSDTFDYLAINYKSPAVRFVIEMDKSGSLDSAPNAYDIIRVAKEPQLIYEVFIPKFTVHFSGDMIVALKELGLSKVFNASKDFSKITDHQMSISTILQNSFIQVDEQGTEVALFTFAQEVGEIASMVDTARFVADHPFYFHIIDVQNNVILFSGSLTNPQASLF
jgi:serpin B